MGDGLHHPLVQMEGGLHQSLAVAGGAGSGDHRGIRQLPLKLTQSKLGGADGVALIVGVELPQQLPGLPDQRQLGGGGAGINAQITLPLIGGKLRLVHHSRTMTAAKILIFCFVPEQGLQPGHLKGAADTLAQGFHQRGQGYALGIRGLQCRAHGGEEMGVFRVYGGFLRQMQGADKGGLQLRQEVQRPAQKGHGAPDGLAAGKAGDGLVHHRLKNGGSQIGLGGTLVDQGLDIRLGKHAAPGGDGIDLLVLLCRLVEAGGIGL